MRYHYLLSNGEAACGASINSQNIATVLRTTTDKNEVDCAACRRNHHFVGDRPCRRCGATIPAYMVKHICSTCEKDLHRERAA